MNAEIALFEVPSAPKAGIRHFALTWVIAIGLASLINRVWGARSLLKIIEDGRPLAQQVVYGLGAGLAIATAAGLLLKFSSLDKMLNRLDLSGFNPLWMSLLAGSCEEILFRGALQPVAGIWWASLLFTLAHARTGRLSAMKWTKALYVAFLISVSLMLGVLCSTVGLVAAVCAHTTVDLVALTAGKRASVFSPSRT